MRAPSSAALRAIAHARLRLLATPKTIPVFPSRSIVTSVGEEFRVQGSGFRVPRSNSELRTRNSERHSSLPFVRRDLQRHILAGSSYQNFDLFTCSHLAQCICVIVDVLDRRLAKPDDNIIGTQTGFLCRRAGPHAVQLHPIALIGIVWNCSQVDSKTAAGWFLFRLHLCERDTLRLVG